MSEKVLLAVNGTLMRGLALHSNLTDAGATFIKKSKTEKAYRLYSINDQYPAMIKEKKGQAIEVELYEISEEGMQEVLSKESEGLTIDKITLVDKKEVYGVIGLPSIIEGQKDITSFKGWRKYIASLKPIHKFIPLIVKGSIILGLLLIFLILVLLKKNPDIAEGMSRTIARGYGATVSGISSILPFVSLMELFFLALFGGIITLLVFFIIDLVKKRIIKAFCRILNIAIMVISTITTYQLSCEAAYNRKPIPLPYYEGEVEREEYIDIFNYFATDINTCVESLEFDNSGDVKTKMNIWDIAKEVKKAYSILDGNSYYNSHFGSVKPMMSSFLYREFQITGFTFSPSGEANIDVLIPVGDLPFTIAHELAHTKGVMREDEANQLAFYVCLNSDNPFLRFSAYSRYFYLMRSMASTSYLTDEEREQLVKVDSSLSKLESFEYKFWKEHNLLAKIGDFFNNLYIKSSGVSGGTSSYHGGTEYTYDPTEHRITPSKYHKLFFEKYYRA